jgi:Ca-activated chloride channel homolog
MTRGFRVTSFIFGTALLVVLFALVPFAAKQSSLRAVEFEHPWRLLLLLLVPIALLAWALTLAGRSTSLKLGTFAPYVHASAGLRSKFIDLPMMLRACALIFGVFAFARPQTPLTQDANEQDGIDIMIALDLSNSMAAILDDESGSTGFTKRPTRLDAAKRVVIDFLGRRVSDRVGVIVFGKAAFVLSPPTLDRTVLSSLVSKMELNLIDGQGTAIGEAVGTSVARLRRSVAPSKVIVLLTDGDSNAGSITPETSIHLAKKEHAQVYTVQLGNGDMVDVQQGAGIDGTPFYVKQRFPVNPELLARMAKETGGEAFIATDRQALETSMHKILDKLERTKLESTSRPMDELFPWFLLPMLAALVLEWTFRTTVLRRLA